MDPFPGIWRRFADRLAARRGAVLRAKPQLCCPRCADPLQAHTATATARCRACGGYLVPRAEYLAQLSRLDAWTQAVRP